MNIMKNCLFFTESNRPTYADLDGNLYHLRLSQTLTEPKAILCGSMELVHTTNPNPEYQRIKYNLPLDQMLPKHFPNIPIIYDLPFSHFLPEFLIFPLGIRFHLRAFRNEGVTLTQLEPAVAV